MLGDEVELVLVEVGQVEHREVEETIETEDLNTKCFRRDDYLSIVKELWVFNKHLMKKVYQI